MLQEFLKCVRNGYWNKEFVQFLFIALGSCFELETQLILANEFRYINPTDFHAVLTEITKLEKMINSLIIKLRQ
ncbi:MAG TPA: four helix bundle protein [Bacteroidia bacterium]|nr:four helix bundle protein [Bacteroidia bacterium]